MQMRCRTPPAYGKVRLVAADCLITSGRAASGKSSLADGPACRFHCLRVELFSFAMLMSAIDRCGDSQDHLSKVATKAGNQIPDRGAVNHDNQKASVVTETRAWAGVDSYPPLTSGVKVKRCSAARTEQVPAPNRPQTTTKLQRRSEHKNVSGCSGLQAGKSGAAGGTNEERVLGRIVPPSGIVRPRHAQRGSSQFATCNFRDFPRTHNAEKN